MHGFRHNHCYSSSIYCALINFEGAQTLASYGQDFYAGFPTVTCNKYAVGEAYYLSSRNEDKFLSDFYQAIIKTLSLSRILEIDLPEVVTA